METTITDAEGRFSLSGLRASDYLVEVFEGEEVIAKVRVSLAGGAMIVNGVTVSVPPDSGNGGLSTGAWIAIGAAAAVGVAGAVLCGGLPYTCSG